MERKKKNGEWLTVMLSGYLTVTVSGYFAVMVTGYVTVMVNGYLTIRGYHHASDGSWVVATCSQVPAYNL